MSIQSPEISVLISTYDDRALVEKKLRELQKQTAFKRAEFLFIEPASPGRERELLEPFCEKHQNCRLIALEERVSLYRAWNIGWEAALAPLVCVSNMDDSMHPELLERVLLDSNEKEWDVASVLIGKQLMDVNLDDWSSPRIKNIELSTRAGPFFVWKRRLKESLGMFDTDFKCAGDKDFWARIQSARLSMSVIPKILYLYTKHPNQLSKLPAFKEQRRSDAELGERKAAPYVWPAFYPRKVRVVRFLRLLPFFGRRFIVDACRLKDG